MLAAVCRVRRPPGEAGRGGAGMGGGLHMNGLTCGSGTPGEEGCSLLATNIPTLHTNTVNTFTSAVVAV